MEVTARAKVKIRESWRKEQSRVRSSLYDEEIVTTECATAVTYRLHTAKARRAIILWRC